MLKTLLTTFAAAGMLSLTAQAQTSPAAPAGNSTPGTTASPVDPTSAASPAENGVTGHRTPGKRMNERSTTTGNRTAGTTNNPVDPTSNMAGSIRTNDRSVRATGVNPRKTYKTKTRVYTR